MSGKITPHGELFLPIKDDVFSQIQAHHEDDYQVVEIDLSVARNKQEYRIRGTYCSVLYADKTANLYIEFNEPDEKPPLLMRLSSEIQKVFYRFFITNSVQAGKKIKLYIGNNTYYKANIEFTDDDIITILNNHSILLQDINEKTIDGTYETGLIDKYTIPSGTPTKIKDADPLKLRRHLSIYNSSDTAFVYMGTNNGNCLLPIPPLSERSIPTLPFYQGEVWIKQESGSPIDVITFEGRE